MRGEELNKETVYSETGNIVLSMNKEHGLSQY